MDIQPERISPPPLYPTAEFRAAYASYKDDLLSVAIFLLKNISAAEDALHDVFLHLLEHPPSLRDQARLKSYLATSIVNRARYVCRRDARMAIGRGDSTSDVMEHASPLPVPGAELVQAEDAQLVRHALACLPPEQGDVIVMHLFGSMTFKEISHCLDCGQNTVQSRYRYGMEKLRSLLEEEYAKR